MSRDGREEPAGADESASWDDTATAPPDDDASRSGASWDDTATAPPDDDASRSGASWDDTAGPPGERRPRESGDRPADGDQGGSGRWIDTLREQQHDPPERRRGRDRTDTMDPGLFDAGVLTFSVRYPFSVAGSEALLTGVLGLVSFLVVPGILAVGYLTRLAGAAARAEEPPGYDDLWGLARCGVVVTGLWWVTGVALAALVYATASESVPLASVLAFSGAYLLPGLLTTYAATEDLREAVARTPEFAFTRKYAFHFAVTAALTVGAVFTGFIVLLLVTFVVLLVPLLTLIPAAYWGYLYGEAIDEGLVAPLPADGG